MSLVRFQGNNGLAVVVSEATPLPIALTGESIEVNANVNFPSTINAVIANTTPVVVVGPSNGNGQLGVVSIAPSQLPLPIRIDSHNYTTPLPVAVQNTTLNTNITNTPSVNATISGQPVRVKTDFDEGDMVHAMVMGFAGSATLRTHSYLADGYLVNEWESEVTTLSNTNEYTLNTWMHASPWSEMRMYSHWTLHIVAQNMPANAVLNVAVDARRNIRIYTGTWVNLMETTWDGMPIVFEGRHFTEYRLRVRVSQVGTPAPVIIAVLVGTLQMGGD